MYAAAQSLRSGRPRLIEPYQPVRGDEGDARDVLVSLSALQPAAHVPRALVAELDVDALDHPQLELLRRQHRPTARRERHALHQERHRDTAAAPRVGKSSGHTPVIASKEVQQDQATRKKRRAKRRLNRQSRRRDGGPRASGLVPGGPRRGYRRGEGAGATGAVASSDAPVAAEPRAPAMVLQILRLVPHPAAVRREDARARQGVLRGGPEARRGRVAAPRRVPRVHPRRDRRGPAPVRSSRRALQRRRRGGCQSRGHPARAPRRSGRRPRLRRAHRLVHHAREADGRGDSTRRGGARGNGRRRRRRRIGETAQRGGHPRQGARRRPRAIERRERSGGSTAPGRRADRGRLPPALQGHRGRVQEGEHQGVPPSTGRAGGHARRRRRRPRAGRRSSSRGSEDRPRPSPPSRTRRRRADACPRGSSCPRSRM